MIRPTGHAALCMILLEYARIIMENSVGESVWDLDFRAVSFSPSFKNLSIDHIVPVCKTTLAWPLRPSFFVFVKQQRCQVIGPIKSALWPSQNLNQSLISGKFTTSVTVVLAKATFRRWMKEHHSFQKTLNGILWSIWEAIRWNSSWLQSSIWPWLKV